MGSGSWQAGKSQWLELKSSWPRLGHHEEVLPERVVGLWRPCSDSAARSCPLVLAGCAGDAFPSPGSAGLGTAKGSGPGGESSPQPQRTGLGSLGATCPLPGWVWAERAAGFVPGARRGWVEAGCGRGEGTARGTCSGRSWSLLSCAGSSLSRPAVPHPRFQELDSLEGSPVTADRWRALTLPCLVPVSDTEAMLSDK